MSDTVLIGLLSLIGTSILAFGGYQGSKWVANRQLDTERYKQSGNVKTSSADSLWDAQEAFRKDLTAEVERLRVELVRQKEDCEKRLITMEDKVEAMKRRLREAGEA